MQENQSPSRSQKKGSLPVADRAGFSPNEFAALFGKQAVWAYRQIYAGRIRCVKGFGRTIIPRSELDKVLEAAQ
jgi:hypothetical protein